jgi:hypothetical protein
MYQFNYEKMRFLLLHFSLHEQEGKNVALILIKQVVPCIMHTENHVGEKIITVLVSIGAAKLQSERQSASLEQYAEQFNILFKQQY